MNKDSFLFEFNSVLNAIKVIKDGREDNKLSDSARKELNSLYKKRDALKEEYITSARPCNPGDEFRTVSYGGRRLRGVAHEFFIRDGEVFIESYYPIKKGVVSPNLAFISMPHSTLLL